VDFVQHPEYVNATNASPLDFYDHDVGLCKLNEPVDIDTSTVTLELNEDASVPTTGDEMTVVGLGFESLYDLVSPLTYPNITQDITLTADTNCTLSPYSENPELKFCSSDIGRGACLADNGGPVVTKSGGVHTLIGLTSYFGECHAEGSTFPVVFSRTSACMPWINAAICDLGSVSESCTTKKEKKSKSKKSKKSKSKKSKKSKSKKSKKSKNKKSKSEKSEKR
jgi:secreted trypsin-like serine protease